MVSKEHRWWIDRVLEGDGRSLFEPVFTNLKTWFLDGNFSRGSCDRSVELVRGGTCSVEPPI